MAYVLVMLGSALGGLLRYIVGRLTTTISFGFPFGTVLINVVGSFVIGYFGTLTLQTGKHPASDNIRLFVMVGLCGGFTTFSAFSLQTFDLIRSGAWMRAITNAVVSVVLCVAAVSVGHALAHRQVHQEAIAETVEEEFTG
jgi:CrcB protein